MTHALAGCPSDELRYKLGIAKSCGTVKFCAIANDMLTTAKEVIEYCTMGVVPILIGSAVNKDFIPFTDLLEDSGDAFPKDNRVESGDLAVVVYSSGTTGPPKGIPLAHKQLVSHMTVPRITMREGDIYLLSTPLSHAGATYMTMSALSLGATLLALPHLSDPEHYSIAIDKYKATYIFCIPPLIVSLVKKGYELPTLQRCDTAGSTCSPTVIREARITHPHLVINTGLYGMSEIGFLINTASETEQASNKRGVLMGKPVAKSQAKVVDPITKRLLPSGVAGELCVRSAYIMRGYINNPEATARTIDSDGWMHTGDLVQYDDDGFLYFIDRLKDIIRIAPDKTTSIQV
ncbi:PREDICTED: 4-coumarate--CoA ligase 4-like [Priapulus caudatus]|uniref:4-coumarate--CoA ligase 4-like n=1 Tax=Priapulus caudatus TaxID=37621 RepID=A0ABM1DVT6_PRICU|nr:PREDICTED: 4-coumarate--CoA ligase 4-like [Priapulus caudatus]